MHLRFRGALTFDEDDALENGLTVIEKKVQETENSFLTMEHLQTLGLHVTVNYQNTATQSQVEGSRDILIALAKMAYSGYVDMFIDEVQQARFHAKEIDPKDFSVGDL